MRPDQIDPRAVERIQRERNLERAKALEARTRIADLQRQIEHYESIARYHESNAYIAEQLLGVLGVQP